VADIAVLPRHMSKVEEKRRSENAPGEPFATGNSPSNSRFLAAIRAKRMRGWARNGKYEVVEEKRRPE